MGQIVIAADAIRYDLELGARRVAARRRRAKHWRAAIVAVVLAVAAWIGYRVTRVVEPPNFEAAVRAAPDDPERWAQAAIGFGVRRMTAASAGAYGVARLLASGDSRWRDRPVDNAADAVVAAGIADDGWIGTLAGKAEQAGLFPVAEQLFARALERNGSKPDWGRGVERTRALLKVRSNIADGQAWGNLGNQLGQSNDAAAAEAAYAIARLLDPQRQAWAQRKPRLTTAPLMIRRLGITNFGWIVGLASAALRLKAFDAAAAVYTTAAELDPANRLWPARVAEARLLARLDSSYRDKEFWGQLGDAYSQEASPLARGAYAAAHLIDPGDGEWAAKAKGTSPADAIALMRAINVRNDNWIGSLADSAGARGDVAAEQALRQYARELNPSAPLRPPAGAPAATVAVQPQPAVVPTAQSANVDVAAPEERELATPAGTPSSPPATVTTQPPASVTTPPAVAEPPRPLPSPPPPVVETPRAIPPPGPAFRLNVRAPFPVMVAAAGRVSQAARSHDLMLPSGAQSVVITAPQVFLRRQIEVNAQNGGSRVEDLPAPVAVRAASVPPLCTLTINGTYAGTLPQTFNVLPGPNRFDCEWTAINRKSSVTVNVTGNGQQVFVTAQN